MRITEPTDDQAKRAAGGGGSAPGPQRLRGPTVLADRLLELARAMQAAESRLRAALEEAAQRGELERIRLLLARWRSVPLEHVVPPITGSTVQESTPEAGAIGATDGT